MPDEELYGQGLRDQERRTTYKGRELIVTQRLTVDGRVPWRVVSACAATHVRGRLHSAPILDVIVAGTVLNSNFGIHEPDATTRITDEAFGYFLYEWLGGPQVLEQIVKPTALDYQGKSGGSPKGGSTTRNSKPPRPASDSDGKASPSPRSIVSPRVASGASTPSFEVRTWRPTSAEPSSR